MKLKRWLLDVQSLTLIVTPPQKLLSQTLVDLWPQLCPRLYCLSWGTFNLQMLRNALVSGLNDMCPLNIVGRSAPSFKVCTTDTHFYYCQCYSFHQCAIGSVIIMLLHSAIDLTHLFKGKSSTSSFLPMMFMTCTVRAHWVGLMC